MTAPAMEPTSIASAIIGARVARVTVLDNCGRILYRRKAFVVSRGFTSVEIGPEVEEGTDYSQKAADGDWCVVGKDDDLVKWNTVKLTMCQMDPDFFTMFNRSWKLVTDAQGRSTGFRGSQKLSGRLGFALELWPKLAEGEVACDDDANPDADPTGYMLFPWVVAQAPDSVTWENGVATFALNGRTRTGSPWGVGPYDVVRQVGGEPGPLLVPIDDGRISGDPDPWHYDRVDVAPPPAMVGAQPLSNPAGPVFTVEPVPGEPLDKEFTPPGVGGPFMLDPGDGTAPVVLPGAGLVHSYAAPGTYWASVWVTANPNLITFQQVAVSAV